MTKSTYPYDFDAQSLVRLSYFFKNMPVVKRLANVFDLYNIYFHGNTFDLFQVVRLSLGQGKKLFKVGKGYY